MILIADITTQLDHPLILVSEAVMTFGLFRLFFGVRRLPSPLPQSVGLVALFVMGNLVARVYKFNWFFFVDIGMYITLALVICIAVYATAAQKKIDLERADALPVVKDKLDKWEVKASWAVAVGVFALVLYNYTNVYLDRQTAQQSASISATKENTRVTSQYVKNQQVAKNEREQILHTVTSVSVTTASLVTGLVSLSATLSNGQAGIIRGQKTAATKQAATVATAAKQVNARTAPIQRSAANSDTTKAGVKDLQKRAAPKPPEKRGLFNWKDWNIFSRRDTLQNGVAIITDTLATH